MNNDRDLSQNEQNRALFVQLVVMLATSAMQQLGKLVNPATGKTEVHLEAAEATIDLLDMLRVKTAGNLDEEEQRILADSLHTLRLNYWETRQAQGTGETAPAAAPSAGGNAGEAAPPDSEDKKPKFQKKYS
jgi:hypothetical protein